MNIVRLRDRNGLVRSMSSDKSVHLFPKLWSLG